MIIHKI